MIIAIRKFGSLLISRPAGREAWMAIQPLLKDIPKSEEIILDFEGVSVLSPSWGDEFLTAVKKEYPKIRLDHVTHPGVAKTLEFLKQL